MINLFESLHQLHS